MLGKVYQIPRPGYVFEVVPNAPKTYQYTRFPSGKWLGEWRKNEAKSIQRGTNTTTWYAGNSRVVIVLIWTWIHKRTLHFRTGRYFFCLRILGMHGPYGRQTLWSYVMFGYFVQYYIVRGRFIKLDPRATYYSVWEKSQQKRRKAAQAYKNRKGQANKNGKRRASPQKEGMVSFTRARTHV